MKRREFITLLGSAAATWPMVARAQQAERMRRIGVLMDFAENNSRAHAHMAAFRDGLQKLGWTEDRNIRIDTRWAAFDAESRQRFAKELITLRPDRGHTPGAHWCNQEQSCRLTVNPISLIWSSNRGGRDTDRARTVAERLLIFHSLKGLPTREFPRCVTTALKP